MKRLSMIAAGVVALGLGAPAAHADPTTVEVIPPTPTKTDANGKPVPNPTPNSAPENNVVSPSPGVPGATQTPPADVKVDVNPAQPVQPVAPPSPPPGVIPPTHVIDNNTAAISGAVQADIVPVGAQPFFPGQQQTPVPLAHTWVGRLGAGFLVGGGFEDFTSNQMRNMTGYAGMWTARVLAGTRHFLGLEAAYVGNARSIDALGLQTNANLISNGVEANARVNVPVVMRRAQLLEPFAFAGLGWQHYQVTNTTTFTADLERTDDVMAVPLGGGLEYAIGRFMADGRFTYTSTYYNDLLRAGANLNTWGFSTQVGFSF